MKTALFLSLLLVVLIAPLHAADGLTPALQQGLYEEEVNRNLDKAIEAYRKAVDDFDQNRQGAATAMFRLAESYRKQGRTNEAVIYYERVVREFSDQTNLVAISQNYVSVPSSTTGRDLVTLAGEFQLQAAIPKSRIISAEIELKKLSEEVGGVRDEIQQLEQTIYDVSQTKNPEALPVAITDETYVLDKRWFEVELFKGDFANETARTNALEITRGRMRKWLDAVYLTREKAKVELGKKRLDRLLIRIAETRKSVEEQQAIIDQLLQKFRQMKGLTEAEADAIRFGYTQVPPSVSASVANPGIDEETSEIQRLRTLLKTSPDLLNSPTGNLNWTPLQSAAANGQLRVAQFLLEAGADVNGGVGRRALNVAAAGGHKAVVELLLGKGAPVDGSIGEDRAPLHSAVVLDRRAVAETLLAAKAAVDARAGRSEGQIRSGDTSLMIACRTGNKSMVELLLKSGATVAVKNQGNDSPLGNAISANNVELAMLLLKNGANPNSPVPTLNIAIGRANIDSVKLLLEAGADPNAIGGDGVPLLFQAIAGKLPAADEIVALMIKAGAKPNTTTTPARARGSPIQSSDDGRLVEPLHFASLLGRTNQVNLLLQSGEDANARTLDGYSPLDFAVANRFPGVVETLIKHGAKVNDRNPGGTTPLWNACFPFNLAVAKILLEAGAEPNVIDESGKTLLEVVSSSGPVGSKAAIDMIALLKRFGVRDDLPRWNQIRWARGAERPSLWRSGDPQNSWDRFTLLELIASTTPTFPDLAKVRILRPQRDGGPARVIPVNVEELIAAEDRTRDPWLEWGDVVEIPTLDHALSATWPGFENEKVEKLVRILQRQVTLICAGQTNKVQLVRRGVPPNSFPQNVFVDGLLSRLVGTSKLLRTSSDLSRVAVRRTDPKTKAIAETIIDGKDWVTQYRLSQGIIPLPIPPQPSVPVPVADNRPSPGIKDVWLRDGDVIEVPEKTER